VETRFDAGAVPVSVLGRGTVGENILLLGLGRGGAVGCAWQWQPRRACESPRRGIISALPLPLVRCLVPAPAPAPTHPRTGTAPADRLLQIARRYEGAL
jgi:hypothetical protein